jgi:uncharacterized membrane protein
MGKQIVGVLYAVAMVAVIVGVDLAFFRNRFWERLMVNIGIVLVFAAFYLRFFSIRNSNWDTTNFPNMMRTEASQRAAPLRYSASDDESTGPPADASAAFLKLQ